MIVNSYEAVTVVTISAPLDPSNVNYVASPVLTDIVYEVIGQAAVSDVPK